MSFSVSINPDQFNDLFVEEQKHYRISKSYAGAGDATPGLRLPQLIQKYKETRVSIEEPSRIIPITDDNFINKNWNLPFHFAEDFKTYKYYWIEFPIKLHTVDNWHFSKVEIALSFNKEDEEAFTRPKIFKIFPDQSFQQYFKLEAGAEGKINLGLDAKLDFQVAAPIPAYGAVDAKGNVAAAVKSDVDFCIGPFSYQIRSAVIEHNGTGSHEIFWQLNKTRLLNETALKIIVILQVPKSTEKVVVDTAMVTYKNKVYAPSDWLKYITDASNAFKSWFDKDLPVPFEKKYHLTGQMI